jgi:hypothetical protein
MEELKAIDAPLTGNQVGNGIMVFTAVFIVATFGGAVFYAC